MKTRLEEYRTDKFYCKKCKNNDMIPNREGEYIKGFRCQICGDINYPTLPKELETLDKTGLFQYLQNLFNI